MTLEQTSLHSRVTFLVCGSKGCFLLGGDKSVVRELIVRVKGGLKKTEDRSFTTTQDETCFLIPSHNRCLVQTEAATNILSDLSFLSGPI